MAPLISCLSPLYLLQMLRQRCSVPLAIFLAAMSDRCKFYAHAGQWRCNPADRTRDGSRYPPFPAGESLIRSSGAGCARFLSCHSAELFPVVLIPLRCCYVVATLSLPRDEASAQFRSANTKPLSIKYLSGLFHAFPQPYSQKMWISRDLSGISLCEAGAAFLVLQSAWRRESVYESTS